MKDVPLYRRVSGLDRLIQIKRKYHIAKFCYLMNLMDEKERRLFEMIEKDKVNQK